MLCRHVDRQEQFQFDSHATEVYEFLVADAARTIIVEMCHDIQGTMQGMLSIQRWVSAVRRKQGTGCQTCHSLFSDAHMSSLWVNLWAKNGPSRNAPGSHL